MFGLVLMAVMNNKPVPVSGPRNFYYDCCDPSLSSEEKENCVFAKEAKDHVLTQRNGDTKTYLWSNCRAGKEPWRKYE